MCSSETMPGNDAEAMRRRGRVLGVLVAATVTIELPKYLASLPAFRDWTYPCILVFLGLQAILPFLLARVAPNAAGFDRQWLPRAWSQWAWFLGMVFLLFLCGGLTTWLASRFGFRWTWFPFRTSATFTSATVMLNGVIIVLLVPIAEEVFWRGYALEQLRKVTRSDVALLIQSLLFAIVHLKSGFHFAIAALCYGTVLGLWRIRFRSLLPLVLAHMILNGTATAQILKFQYDMARWAAYVTSKPECRQMDLLAEETIEKAVPAVIGYLADADENVRIYAQCKLIKWTRTRQHRDDIEPYLKKALTSGDKNTVNGLLTVIDFTEYSGLKQAVRDVVWSAEDPEIQLSATMTLRGLQDAEGLQRVAREHPNEKVRGTAERLLGYLRE